MNTRVNPKVPVTASRVRWSGVSVLTVAALSALAGFFAGSRLVHRTQTSPSVPPTASTPRDTRPDRPTPRERSSTDEVAWSGEGLEARWRALQSAPRTARNERDLAEVLVEIASHDHNRAMEMALAEPNWRLRSDLRNAALRGWATTDAKGAADYSLGLREEDREKAMAAVLEGAAVQPASAATVAASVCDRDPERAFFYAESLITSLADRGAFEVTERFLASRPQTPQRLEEATNAFALWAQHRPADACAAANAIADPEFRDAAFRGMVAGWGQANPISLAEYAAKLPAGDARAVALANAVPHWIEQDPVAAAAWLAQQEPHPDFDTGVVAVATQPNLIAQRPDLAASLAQSISDDTLRKNTIEQLAAKWAQTDRAAAVRYVQGSSQFSDAEKNAILAAIEDHPHP